jgi:hypothetical protein
MGLLEWRRKGSDIVWGGTRGQLIKGVFNATTAGYGLPLNASRTWIERGNADDGYAALPVDQAYLFGSRRLLLTYPQVGNISAFGGQDRLSIAGDESGITAEIGGHWAMLEIKSGGVTPANGVGCACYRADLAVNSGSTVSANSIVSAFCAAAEKLSATTHTGKYAVLHVPNPQAGTFDYFAVFGSATGCVDAHSAGSTTSGLQLLITIGGSAYAIPVAAVGT